MIEDHKASIAVDPRKNKAVITLVRPLPGDRSVTGHCPLTLPTSNPWASLHTYSALPFNREQTEELPLQHAKQERASLK